MKIGYEMGSELEVGRNEERYVCTLPKIDSDAINFLLNQFAIILGLRCQTGLTPLHKHISPRFLCLSLVFVDSQMNVMED